MILLASYVSPLTRWEWGEYISEFFVILACAGEVVAVFGKKRLTEEHKERLEKLSTVLLVAALSAALICLVRTNELSGNVIGSLGKTAEEADGEAKTAISDSSIALSQAKDALTKAGNAEGSLGKAEDEANKAQTASSNALTLASKARQEADSFEADIKTAKQQAADAESHLADALQQAAKAEAELYRIKTPRSLIRTEELIAALRPFSGTEYTLNVFMDDESIQFTKIVAAALDASGWVRKQPTGISIGVPTLEIDFGQGGPQNVPACIDTGVSLSAHVKESLAVLKSLPPESVPKTVKAALALKSAIALSISPSDERNVDPGVIAPKPEEGIPMTVCIGKKP